MSSPVNKGKSNDKNNDSLTDPYPQTPGRAHKLSTQQHRPQQQHRQHRAVRDPVAPRFPTRSKASTLRHRTPSRTPPLPHTPTRDRDSCSVSNCPRNPPVWSRRRRPAGSDRGSPVPTSWSVWGSWGALSRWRPLPGWQPGWISLWHTKHSQPSDGLASEIGCCKIET